MAAYIVLSPAGGRTLDPDCRFVRDGFSWVAAIFPILHAIVQGLVTEGLVLIVARAFGLALLVADETRGAGFILLLASSLIYGFEARARLAASLSRKGWKAERVITAASLADAEAIHYGEGDAEWSDDPVSKLVSTKPPQRPNVQFGMIDFQKGR